MVTAAKKRRLNVPPRQTPLRPPLVRKQPHLQRMRLLPKQQVVMRKIARRRKKVPQHLHQPPFRQRVAKPTLQNVVPHPKKAWPYGTLLRLCRAQHHRVIPRQTFKIKLYQHKRTQPPQRPPFIRVRRPVRLHLLVLRNPFYLLVHKPRGARRVLPKRQLPQQV